MRLERSPDALTAEGCLPPAMIWTVQIKKTARERHPTGEECRLGSSACRAGRRQEPDRPRRVVLGLPTASALATALNAALPRAPVRAGGTGARRWFSRPAPSCSVRRTSRRPSNSSTTGGRCSAGRSQRALRAVLWRRSTHPSRARIERARAAIRRVVWTLLALRPGGLPWFSVCGRELANWYVLDRTRPSSPAPAARKTRRAPSGAASVTCR